MNIAVQEITVQHVVSHIVCPGNAIGPDSGPGSRGVADKGIGDGRTSLA